MAAWVVALGDRARFLRKRARDPAGRVIAEKPLRARRRARGPGGRVGTGTIVSLSQGDGTLDALGPRRRTLLRPRRARRVARGLRLAPRPRAPRAGAAALDGRRCGRARASASASTSPPRRRSRSSGSTRCASCSRSCGRRSSSPRRPRPRSWARSRPRPSSSTARRLRRARPRRQPRARRRARRGRRRHRRRRRVRGRLPARRLRDGAARRGTMGQMGAMPR